MKVKNIMFFGFAAAILSAGAANAAVSHPTASTYNGLSVPSTATDATRKIVTSKAYVDKSTNALKADIEAINIPGAVADLSDAANYELVANKLGTSNGETTIDNTSTDTQYPTAKNVYEYVAAQPGATAYTGTGLIDVNGHTISTTAQANVIETVKVNDSALTPDANKAVNITVPTTVASLSDAGNYELVSRKDATNNGVTTISSSSDDTHYPTSKNVYEYVAAQPGATAYTGTGLIDVTGHTISTTAQANVIETVKVNDSALTPDANKAVNITVPTTVASLSDAGNYELVANKLETSNGETTIDNTSTDTQYPTAKNVYEYVQDVTNGNSIPTMPTQCSTSGYSCALVTNTSGELQWVVMATDQHGGSETPTND